MNGSGVIARADVIAQRLAKTISPQILKQYGAKTYDELQGGEEEANGHATRNHA